MEKIYLLGAGKKAVELMDILPYGVIAGVMDSDENKVGKIFYSFKVEKTNLLYIKECGYQVLLTYSDKKVEEEMTALEIRWYVGGGKNYQKLFYAARC